MKILKNHKMGIKNTIQSFLFKNKTTKQTIVKNTFWLSIGTFLSRLIRATLIIYAGRVLGTAGYGVFSYALSLAAFFTIFSDIGISGLLTRQLVQKPEDSNKYLSTSLVLKIIVLIITILITIVVAPHFTKIQEVSPLIPIVAFLLAFDSLRGFGFSITRARNKMEIESILTFLTNTLITIFGFLALILAPSPKNLAWGYALASGIGTLIVFNIVRKYFKKEVWDFDKSLIKPILKKALPFAIMGILGAFMINIDTIIIGVFHDANDLGLYGAAQRIVQLLYMIPGFMAISMFPIISKFIKNKQTDRASAIIKNLIHFIFAISLPLTIGGIIISKQFIILLFGAQYAPVALTFALLLVTVLIVTPSAIINNALFSLNRQNVFIISGLLGATINVFFDFLLIPKYGILGSAIVTVVALLVVNTYNYIKLKKELPINIFGALKKPILATILMGFATYISLILGINTIIIMIISGFVYILSLVALKDSTFREIKSLFE